MLYHYIYSYSHPNTFWISDFQVHFFRSGMPKSRTTKFYTAAPNICGSSVWNLLHATLPEPRILRWLLNFWKVCAPLLQDILLFGMYHIRVTALGAAKKLVVFHILYDIFFHNFRSHLVLYLHC
jgi:hypothetical protein